MDEYNIPESTSEILPLLDDASNWFVRRSRRRFWKSEDDSDKNDAYRTLHYILVRLATVIAPFTPFLAEELYQKLTGGTSVHLLDWPEPGEVSNEILAQMARTRTVIEQGLAARMQKSDNEAQIKVRQPLASLSYGGEKLDEYYEAIIADEVNVKEVKNYSGEELSVSVDKNITPELRREGMVREVVRATQNARKQAGLNVNDRIVLEIKTRDMDLQTAINEHDAVIRTETLAEEVGAVDEAGFVSEVSIEGVDLRIALRKV